MDQMISTQNVASFLGITRPTVIKYIQDGRLRAARTGKAYKISKVDLVKFAQEFGMSANRLSQLDHFLRSRDKRTKSLSDSEINTLLVQHETPIPLNPEPGVSYFLAVQVHPEAREIIFKVNIPKFFIGRHSLASLSIQDPYVSTLHATLTFHENFVKVIDQSTNGTVLRNQTLKSGMSQIMGDEDQLRVGNVILSIVCPSRIDQYLGFDS